MIDYAKIMVKAGAGGDGRVSFRREKFVPKGGPDGGDGGNGGSVYLLVDKDLRTLRAFQYQQRFRADDGEAGKKAKKHGRNGADRIIRVPRGTIVRAGKSRSQLADLIDVGQKACVAHGGRGGRGNWHFRSPRNTTPMKAEKGEKGEELELILELKLLAEVGLIGLPNAGKSTLLSVLTKARPKIASYPFTTLEPNLGMMEGVVLADIPGLIEGASKGKGLGTEFLRHIERCRLLVHLLDGSSSSLIKDYQAVRKELVQYDKRLLEKEELVVLNKIDLLSDRRVKTKIQTLRKTKKPVVAISAVTQKNLDNLKKEIIKRVYNKEKRRAHR
jgi:GTP-binding protein